MLTTLKTCFYADFVCSFVSLRKISMTPNRHPHAQLTTKNKSSSFHKSQTDKTFSNHVPTHVLEIFLQCLWSRECSYFWWNEAFQYTALWLKFLIFVQKLWSIFALWIKENLIKVLVFCYQNCSDLLWKKIVLVIKKNFWNSRLKAENLR